MPAALPTDDARTFFVRWKVMVCAPQNNYTGGRIVFPEIRRSPLIRRGVVMLPKFLSSVVCLVLVGWSSVVAAKPNVLIFYADDLGYGETGVYGCKDIPTPHIDALAAAGIKFTQGYIAATYCSPSRAGLMTGRYPTRFGHEFNATARQSGLSLQETTLADRLKSLGYATACVGKWHLGGEAGKQYYPTSRGFDEFYGTLANTPFYHPTNFIDSRTSLDVQTIDDKEFYTTDKYAERAVDWLAKQAGKPWFLYLPFNAQHAPLQAPQKYLDRFPNITDEKRKIFAGMMSAMDDAVGAVMAQVRKQGDEENTLVFYIADNGGPTQSTTSQNGPLRGFKMTTFEGGPRVPYIAQWKGTWPAGATYDKPVMNLDVLPTCLAAAGGAIESSWKLDGLDLSPYVTGKNTGVPHDKMYWRFGEQWGVRSGDWKLVVSRGGSGKPELYNLASDIGEATDLASAEPARVAELQKLYDAWNAEQAPPSAVDSPAKKTNKQANRKAARQANKAKAAAK
jgi:arylsulfatase A-like enzyme